MSKICGSRTVNLVISTGYYCLDDFCMELCDNAVCIIILGLCSFQIH